MKRNFAPAAVRLRAVVARLGAIPALYEAARQNVENPPAGLTTLALRMAKGCLSFFETATPKWAATAPAAGLAPAADPALLAAFKTANDAATTATRAFVAWLEHDLRPRSRGTFALG